MFEPLDDIIEAATTKSNGVGLPAPVEGPRDAYRHLIGAAELRRRFGPVAAFTVLGASEVSGHSRGSPWQSTWQDLTNDQLGLGIGAVSNTFDDVIARALAAMQAGIAVGGTGEGAMPRWAPPAGSPERWADPDHEFPDHRPGAAVYPSGGPEHGFPRQVPVGEEPTPREREARLLGAFARLPPAHWTDSAARSVIRSRPLNDSRNPSRADWNDRLGEHLVAREAQSVEAGSLEAE